MLSTSGYALLLQVAHPTVGAGVAQHSNFQDDPWGRLVRTLDFVNLLVYGDAEETRRTGERVRDMHKRIKGVKQDGSRYHALEPEAYAWVHATLAETIIAAHQRFGRRLSQAEVETFWAEWRELGAPLGVRERDLPAGWDEFREWVRWMVEERLDDNETVRTVLRSLTAPAPPPGIGESTWRVMSLPAARATQLATVGLLPQRLRDKLALPWTPLHEAQLRVLGRVTRPATPVMPRSLRRMGPAWLRWREEQIERGMFGPQAAA